MKLRLTILNQTIDIDLLDHDLNREIIKKIPNANGFKLSILKRPNIVPINRKRVKGLWRRLREAYYNFHAVSRTTKEALTIPEKFDYSNYWTNILHRIFTNALEHHTYYGEPFEMNDTIFTFINQINDRVHDLEVYINNYQINRWISTPIQWCEIIPNSLNKYTLITIEEFKDMISTNADVYILKQITGKDFITAYFDNDTSNSWDVNNGEVTYVGLCIDYRNDFKKIWGEQHFLDWVRSYNFQGKIGYIPIGNINPIQKMLLKDLIKGVQNAKKNNIPCNLEIID